MSYEPTNWVNGETPINAENLNKIEQELKNLSENGGGGGNATVEEMTWAEYEALSEEDKMDGTLRVITDRNAGVTFGKTDISDVGDGTVTGAIKSLSSNAEVTETTISSPYGDIYITKVGRVVMASAGFSKMDKANWVTITDKMPKACKNLYSLGVSGDSTNYVTFYLGTNGTLQFFGRNSCTDGFLMCTYLTND